MTTKAPRIRGPRDVPRLRAHLLHTWQSDLRLTYPTVEVYRDGTEHTRPAGDWDRETLASDVSYWYVTADMCDVLAVAEQQLPTTTMLEPELVPRERGLVVFERSLRSMDAYKPGEQIVVDAIVWGLARIPVEDADRNVSLVRAVGASSYRRLRLDDGMDGREMELLAQTQMVGQVEEAMRDRGLRKNASGWDDMIGDLWVPLGRSDWALGTGITHRHGGSLTDDQQASMEEDRRRLATFWLLTSQVGKQQIAETTVDYGSRQERRAAHRAGEPDVSVRVVSIKPPSVRRPDAEPGERRQLTVRSLVSGHWRNQPYGPERSLRRPIWIDSFWRGPQDAPIRNVDTVKVWKEQS